MYTPALLRGVLALGGLLVAAAAPAKEPEDCDAYYGGEGRSKDFGKALACYRAQEEWVMVTIMQLNGEGTPIDVAGARASFRRHTAGKSDLDMDDVALEKILQKREANPAKKARRVDFCRDVAITTLSANVCDRRDEDRATAKAATALKQVRAGLEQRARAPFDRAVTALDLFVTAESGRAYQEYIDGSIRNAFAISQEALVRTNFAKTIKALTASGAAAPPPPKRPLADADRELNSLYKEKVRSYASAWEKDAATSERPDVAAEFRGYVTDYKSKSRSAQHQWIRYRDAMAKLAAAHWPHAREADDVAKALVTEDRIVELNNSVGEGE